MHYFFVAASILARHGKVQAQDTMLRATEWNPEREPNIHDLLDYYALQICGIAFTTSVPAVLVNAYGPISFCKSLFNTSISWVALICKGGKFIRDAAAQDEVIRHLAASKRAIGWPVERLIDDLKSHWVP